MHDEYVQKERLTENAISGDNEIERMAKSVRHVIVYVTVWNYNLLHHFFTVKELCMIKVLVYTRHNFLDRLY